MTVSAGDGTGDEIDRRYRLAEEGDTLEPQAQGFPVNGRNDFQRDD